MSFYTKKSLTWFTIALCCSLSLVPFSARADKANPQVITATQRDGSVISIKRVGDEYLHYTTDLSGNIMVQQNGMYQYARFGAKGLEISSQKSAQVPASFILKAQDRARQERALMGPSLREMKLPDTKAGITAYKCLVILVEFKDKAFTITDAQKRFSQMLNQEGYAENGNSGSARDYYYDMSYKTFEAQYDVVGPFVLPETIEYYGANDENGSDKSPWKLAVDAAKVASVGGVDFSQYDQDNDGIVDNLFVFYAGYAESNGAPENTIWPHASSVYGQADTEYNGKKLASYSCSSELRGTSGENMASIGTFCHEFGHTLGLPDLYDTDYDKNGNASGLRSLSLMGSGNHNNNGKTPAGLTSVERELLGWLSFTELSEEGSYELQPIQQAHAFRMNTSNEGEFFVFEYRTPSLKWDKNIGGSGMLALHVDQSQNPVGGATAADAWYHNNVNDFSIHECLRVIEAVEVPVGTVSSSIFFPGSASVTALGAETQPALLAWSGMPVGLNLEDITDSGRSVSFQVKRGTDANIGGTITKYSNKDAVYGAQVYLAPITYTPATKSGALAEANFSTSAPGVLFCKSSVTGTYRFTDVEEGVYQLICVADGYVTFYEEVEVKVGETTRNVTLYTQQERDQVVLSWSKDDIRSGLGNQGSTFMVGVLFDAQDLSKYANSVLEGISFGLYNGSKAEATLEVRVYRQDSLLMDSTLVNSDLLWNKATNYLDLSTLKEKIVVEEGFPYLIAFRFSNYDSNGYPIAMDGLNPVDGKGNLFYSGGKWVSLLEDSNISGNYCIKAHLKKSGKEIPVKAITMETDSLQIGVGHKLYLVAAVSPANATSWQVAWSSSDETVASVNALGVVTGVKEGTARITAKAGIHKASCTVTVSESMAVSVTSEVFERMVNLAWDAKAGADNWKVSWKAGSYSNVVYSAQTQEPSLLLDSLRAGTLYLIYIDSYVEDKQVDGCVLQVTTKTVTSAYAAIRVPAQRKAGEKMFLEVMNIGAAQQVEWFLDGAPLAAPYWIMTAGKHQIKAVIKDTDSSGDEIIIKTLTVE